MRVQNFVYTCQIHRKNYIKIGVTGNPTVRFRQYNVLAPDCIYIVFFHPEAASIEVAVKHKFSLYCLKGEKFSVSPDSVHKFYTSLGCEKVPEQLWKIISKLIEYSKFKENTTIHLQSIELPQNLNINYEKDTRKLSSIQSHPSLLKITEELHQNNKIVELIEPKNMYTAKGIIHEALNQMKFEIAQEIIKQYPELSHIQDFEHLLNLDFKEPKQEEIGATSASSIRENLCKELVQQLGFRDLNDYETKLPTNVFQTKIIKFYQELLDDEEKLHMWTYISPLKKPIITIKKLQKAIDSREKITIVKNILRTYVNIYLKSETGGHHRYFLHNPEKMKEEKQKRKAKQISNKYDQSPTNIKQVQKISCENIRTPIISQSPPFGSFSPPISTMQPPFFIYPLPSYYNNFLFMPTNQTSPIVEQRQSNNINFTKISTQAEDTGKTTI